MPKYKVSVKKGKGGTLVARATVKLKKSDVPSGTPMYKTKAQLLVRLNGNGRKQN